MDNSRVEEECSYVSDLLDTVRIAIPHEDDDEYVEIHGEIQHSNVVCQTCGNGLLCVRINAVYSPWMEIDPAEEVVKNIKNLAQEVSKCPMCHKDDAQNGTGSNRGNFLGFLLVDVWQAVIKNDFWGFFQVSEEEYIFDTPRDFTCPKCGNTVLHDLTIKESESCHQFHCPKCLFTGDFEEFETQHTPSPQQLLWPGPLIKNIDHCPGCGESLLIICDTQRYFCSGCPEIFGWDEAANISVQGFCPQCQSEKIVEVNDTITCIDCRWKGQFREVRTRPIQTVLDSS